MIKEKKSLKVSNAPSRRKFFKAAAATGAAAAGGLLAGCEPANANMQLLVLNRKH
jgi:hypothetical protein